MGGDVNTADRGPIALKRECWASQMGDCSGVLSKEHVISDSILDLVGGVSLQMQEGRPDILFTSGINNGYRVVGNPNFVIKYLCEHHNRKLSPFDREAKKFLETLQLVLGKPPEKIKAKRPTYKVNGLFLEKWLAKTFMNVFVFGYQLQKNDLPFHPTYINSARFADSIWSPQRFKKPFGLYYMCFPVNRKKITIGHQDLKVQIKYVVIEILEPSGHKFLQYVPMAIGLRYLGFGLMGVFNLTGHTDAEFERIYADQIRGLQQRCHYHPAAINLTVGQSSSDYQRCDQLKFRW